MGTRDVWHLLHRSLRAECLQQMPCILSVRDITIKFLYPMGTAAMDTFRRQENLKRYELIIHKMVPRSCSLS